MNIYTESWFNVRRGSGYPEYLTYGNCFVAGAMPRTTLESCLPIMTSQAGCSIPNNPAINYTKLKQKRHYLEQYYDVQYATHGYGASSS